MSGDYIMAVKSIGLSTVNGRKPCTLEAAAKHNKRELAAEAAGVLAASAIHNRDKVGLILFSDVVELYIPPGKGRMHIMRLIRETLFFQPAQRGTDITKALDFANQIIHRKAVIFLVSDFNLGAPFDERLAELRGKLQITNRRHDVIAVSVTDPREESLPDVGRIRIEDAENGMVVELDTGNTKVRNAYAEQARQRRNLTATRIRSLGVDLLEFINGENWLPVLMGFFHKRRQRAV
ncbi:MAG: VWA domain-containing protein [Verrucomicrobia bacterium]|nr:VWA domain-containing protein [Verrucomicrobiota bacterium]